MVIVRIDWSLDLNLKTLVVDGIDQLLLFNIPEWLAKQTQCQSIKNGRLTCAIATDQTNFLAWSLSKCRSRRARVIVALECWRAIPNGANKIAGMNTAFGPAPPPIDRRLGMLIVPKVVV